MGSVPDEIIDISSGSNSDSSSGYDTEEEQAVAFLHKGMKLDDKYSLYYNN
jgi:hypothetical protein